MSGRIVFQSTRSSSALICLLAATGFVGDARAGATPEAVEKAVSALDLSKDQTEKAAHVIDRYRQMEKQAYDAMLLQMNASLTADQFRALKAALSETAASATTEADGSTHVPVTITGGYDTDPRDHGRPVVLVAAALNVPDDVFREAFSGVHPAGPGQQPQEADVRQNKRVLLDALGPYGVKNDRLNEVSNFYRYSKSRGQMWRTKPAKVEAVVRDGKVAAFNIVDAGAGYSSAPTMNVIGFADAKVVVKLKFGTDLASNGSIESVSMAAE